MKKILAVLLISCLMLSAGCSNGNKYSWNNGTMTGPNGPIALAQFEGYKGSVNEFGLDMSFYLCDDIEECSHNTLGIMPESMARMEKAYYYTGYLGTQMWMLKENPNGDGWLEAHVSITADCVLPTESIAGIVYDKLNTLSLSEGIPELDINGVIALNTRDWDFKARPNEVIIPGVLRITVDDGSKTMTTTETFGEYSLGKYVGEKYTYYTYEGLLIQIVSGLSLQSYITFK